MSPPTAADLQRLFFHWYRARQGNLGPPLWCAQCAIDVMSHEDTRVTVSPLLPAIVECGECGYLFPLTPRFLDDLWALFFIHWGVPSPVCPSPK